MPVSAEARRRRLGGIGWIGRAAWVGVGYTHAGPAGGVSIDGVGVPGREP